MQVRHYLQALGIAIPLFTTSALGRFSVTSLNTWSPSGRPGTSPDYYIHANITDPDPTKDTPDADGAQVYCAFVWQWPNAPYNQILDCVIADGGRPVGWAWTVELLEATETEEPFPTTNFDLHWRAINLSQPQDGNVTFYSGIGHFEVGKNLQGTCAASGFCSWALKPTETPVVIDITTETCLGTFDEALNGLNCATWHPSRSHATGWNDNKGGLDIPVTLKTSISDKNHMIFERRQSMRGLCVLVFLRMAVGFLSPPICTAPSVFDPLLRCPSETGGYDLIGSNASHGSYLRGGPWSVGNTCYEAGADEYCIYTALRFNDGEGLSLITTAESTEKITARSAFQHKVSIPRTDGPYREVEIPGKSHGLVATKALQAGQNLISRTPALVVNTKAVEKLQRHKLDDLLARAVDSLPLAHRDEVLELSTHDIASTHTEKVGKIFRTNSFSTGFHDGKSNFRSLFTIISRINHSCRPNCVYYFDSNTFSQNVVAVRDIQPGEELSIAYIDPVLPQSERQKRLKSWGFECSCERCSVNATQVAESDGNVAEIHRLWKQLDNYSASSSATPAMAERLIALYRQEGLESRIQEAYYRAAVEWIGLGEAEKAAQHATLCIEYGTLFLGPGRPFIEKMKQLLDGPTDHPQWMFRSNRHADKNT
ncbi:hypothetical protein RRF57_006839 [Xylaria bambusicola]|uniref:SET domain-containing protein n=1 Tax=Xylaria bambusicola TaxID=326684 RepID=A0AAN7UTT5_9PEZI